MKDSWEDGGTRCPVWTWESEHLGKTSWRCAFCTLKLLSRVQFVAPYHGL